MNIVWIIISACIAALVLIFLFTYIKLEVYAEKSDLTGEFEVWIKYLFIKKCIMKPRKEKENKEEKKDESVKKEKSLSEYKIKIGDFLKLFGKIKWDIKDILEYCTKKLIIINKIDLNIEYGLDDPMETGIANGLLYGAIYDILGFVHNYSKIESCNININPNFNKVCNRIEFRCILKLKNVHITVMTVKVLKLIKKIKKYK